MFAENSGWKSRRAFLTSHVSGSTSTVQVEPQKENPARSASFYLDNLDRRSRAIQWAKRGAPESALADAIREIFCRHCFLFTALVGVD
jgi:hypothetical protein